MLEIGRFLMMEPKLVILDEPSIGLAPKLVSEVYTYIEELKQEGLSFLIVEQNVKRLLASADYVYAFEMGRNGYEGTPEHVLAEGHLAELYLGAKPAPRES